LFALGCLTLAAMWSGPLAELARRAFFAHMAVHMGVVAVAAPLLALGVAGGRFDPVRKAPAVFAPVPASMLEFVVVWAWHAPALHHAARHSFVGLAAEQGTFLVSGLWLWLSAVGGDAWTSDTARGGPRGNRTGAGIIGLLLTAMHMTLLGALIALAPRPLYEHDGHTGHIAGHAGYGPAPAGLTPLEDQQLGGAIMILMGGAAYLIGGLSLTVGLLRGRDTKRDEQP
jgi:putative membrane protein